MAIEFHKESQTFHLHNAWISYIFKVLPSGHLGQLYYGRAIHDRPDFDHLFEMAYRSMSVHYFDGEPAYSLEHIKQEYPTCGTGDIHLPALDAVAPNGSRLLDLHYQSHTIAPGKPPLEGGELPSTYVESPDEAVTLTVTLADALAGVTVDLVYTLYEGLPVLTRHAVIGYTGEGTLRLDRAMSFCLDLPDMDYDLVELTAPGPGSATSSPGRWPTACRGCTPCGGAPATTSTPSSPSSGMRPPSLRGRCTASAWCTAATLPPRPTWTPTTSPV